MTVSGRSMGEYVQWDSVSQVGKHIFQLSDSSEQCMEKSNRHILTGVRVSSPYTVHDAEMRIV